MPFEATAIRVLKDLAVDHAVHHRATVITSRLAEHYAGQVFLWGVDEREQSFFPLKAGLPPIWGGVTMQYLYLVQPEGNGYRLTEIGHEDVPPLLRKPPALPLEDKAQLVTDVTRVLSMTCWGVIQDPPFPKSNPAHWPHWQEYFSTNNPVMEQFMATAISQLNA